MLFPLPPEERTASLGLQGTDKGCEIASLLPVLAQLLADEGGTGACGIRRRANFTRACSSSIPARPMCRRN